jgi:FKBP-type peptidyl-prolyl cis-trans isomerase FkpA
MKLSTIVFGLLAVALFTTACNSVDFKKTSAGVPYKIFSKESKGDSIKPGYVVKLQVVKKVKDSILFNTYANKRAAYLQLQMPTTPFSYNDIGSNVMEILSKAKKGDSIYLVQETDSLMKDPQLAGQYKKGQQVSTAFRVEDVYKTTGEADAAIAKENEPFLKEEASKYEKAQQESLAGFQKDSSAQAQLAKDSKQIDAYIASHHIQAQKTDWGIYIEQLAPGNGQKPSYGKFASVRYKGLHLNGQSFDEGVYPLQIGRGGAIPGFEMGVAQLSKGEKARIYIPSLLAYGAQGSPPKIAPNENLIFELELLDISDTPPNQQGGR